MEPAGWDALAEKIKYNLPTDDPSLNTRINLQKRLSRSRPTIKVEKESVLLNFLELKMYQIIMWTAGGLYLLTSAVSRRYESFRK